MKRWFSSLVLPAVVFATVAVKQAHSGEVKLDSAEAIFETLDNDKDHDSIVCIAVKNGNTVIASSCNSGGHWNDHSNHTVSLDVGSGWTRSALSGRTKTELSFSTNGNDKLQFNYLLRLNSSHHNPPDARYNDQPLPHDSRLQI